MLPAMRMFSLVFKYWSRSRQMRFDPHAYTLLELLLTLVIVAILIALLALSSARALGSSRQVACSANLRQIDVAIVSYEIDFDGYFPDVNTTTASWWDEVTPYLKNTAVLQCPVHTLTAFQLGNRKPTAANYAMNWTLGANHNTSYRRKSAILSSPENTMLVTEAGLSSNGTAVPQLDGSWLLQCAQAYNGGGVHHGGNNILWCDGHVSWWQGVEQLTKDPYKQGSTVSNAQDKWAPGFNPWLP